MLTEIDEHQENNNQPPKEVSESSFGTSNGVKSETNMTKAAPEGQGATFSPGPVEHSGELQVNKNKVGVSIEFTTVLTHLFYSLQR